MIARDWRRSSATGTAHKNMFGERGLLGTREIMCRTGTSKVTGVALAEAVLAQGESWLSRAGNRPSVMRHSAVCPAPDRVSRRWRRDGKCHGGHRAVS